MGNNGNLEAKVKADFLTDNMTIEEKLAEIEKAMKNAQIEHAKKYPGDAPLDPQDLLQCEGCQ